MQNKKRGFFSKPISVPITEDKGKALDLIGKLLSINSEPDEADKLIEKLNNLIKKDYMEVANEDDLIGEAELFEELKIAKNMIIEQLKFPFLAGKKIVAIGGGFSAGKSSLVNTIIDDDILPTALDKTTAIPTYIVGGSQKTIYSCNIFGKKSFITEDEFKDISHKFSDRYQINSNNPEYNISFSTILKYIVLQSSKNLGNVMFLDTPGYSASDTDAKIAREHLMKSDYLIWVTEISKNIPKADIEFIKDSGYDKPILFILNKAEKITRDDALSILNNYENELIDNGIKYDDVILFSCHKQEGKSELYSFLSKVNVAKQPDNILERFENIFEKCIDYHQEWYKWERGKLKLLNEMEIIWKKYDERCQSFSLCLCDIDPIFIKRLKNKRNKISEYIFGLLSPEIQSQIDNHKKSVYEKFLNEITKKIINKEKSSIEKEDYEKLIEKIKEKIIDKIDDNTRILDEPLIKEVNEKIINNKKFYNSEIFDKIAFSSETGSLIKKALDEGEKFMNFNILNRLLLEDCYPTEIRNCLHKAIKSEEIRNPGNFKKLIMEPLRKRINDRLIWIDKYKKIKLKFEELKQEIKEFFKIKGK
ncbi:MAG: hypothetical protein ACD_59C00049G0003 [uncultured bacterium]|nr:MAG: hypothetical protein ACD_59C00049G0003 [uncultured bacterium]